MILNRPEKPENSMKTLKNKDNLLRNNMNIMNQQRDYIRNMGDNKTLANNSYMAYNKKAKNNKKTMKFDNNKEIGRLFS